MREERRRELAELENRLTQWMMNFVFAVVGLVMLILPFYILLLRRVLPGLFAPPYYPPQKPESGAAGARAPRKAGA